MKKFLFSAVLLVTLTGFVMAQTTRPTQPTSHGHHHHPHHPKPVHH